MSSMQVVSDLHLHSKYSRAVSQAMNLETMSKTALEKGLDLLSTSDWTHPLWFKELKSKLKEVREGVYSVKTSDNKEKEVFFLLSTEISSIYKEADKLRRIHSLVFAPNLEVAGRINMELGKRGCNLSSDGRPIIGLSAKNLLQLILEIDERCFMIPCHVWTPHFGLYGSASGFNSLYECFQDLSPFVYGIETGISSDPEMNWGIKELATRSILSFSDAHSPAKMGREATVFELEEVTYENVRKAIMRQSLKTTAGSDQLSLNKIVYTIEFYPEEGKYHFSGHRNCKISYAPSELKEKGNLCPVCGRVLTEGVVERVQHLQSLPAKANSKSNNNHLKWFLDPFKNQPPFVKIVPLNEVVAESLSSTVFSQKTRNLVLLLIQAFGSEFEVLLKAPFEKISQVAGEKVAEGLEKVRKGDLAILPGFDGEYGKVKLWPGDKKEAEQMGLAV